MRPTTGIRRSRPIRSGWKTMVRASASISGPMMPLAARSPRRRSPAQPHLPAGSGARRDRRSPAWSGRRSSSWRRSSRSSCGVRESPGCRRAAGAARRRRRWARRVEQLGRGEHEGPVLPAAQPAVAADQRLEGRHLLGAGSTASSPGDPGTGPWWPPSAASPGRVSPNGSSGSSPSTTPVARWWRPAPPIATGPSPDITATKPTPGCAARPGTSAGHRGVELLQGHPLRLAARRPDPGCRCRRRRTRRPRPGLLGCDLLSIRRAAACWTSGDAAAAEVLDAPSRRGPSPRRCPPGRWSADCVSCVHSSLRLVP